MRLSIKTKEFSRIFSAFLESRLNFEHIQKNMTLIANVFPKLRTSKNVVRSKSKKYLFRTPLHKQHGKRTQTLLISGWQQF